MKLSRKQIDQLRGGGAPRLAFPGDGPCPVEPGQTIPVCAGLELVIQRIRKSKKGELVASYLIREHRVRLPRRVPHGSVRSKPKRRREESDESYAKRLAIWKEAQRKQATEGFTADDIDKARTDGAMTSSKRIAVPGHDLAENLEEEEQRSVTAKAHARWAMTKNEQAAEEQQRRQERAMRDRLRETLQGLDVPARQALLASIEREIIRARMKAAA